MIFVCGWESPSNSYSSWENAHFGWTNFRVKAEGVKNFANRDGLIFQLEIGYYY